MIETPSYLLSYWNRLKESPLGYRLARGALWNLLAAVMPKAVSLVAFMIIARLIGKKEFGGLGIVQNTVGMMGVFAGFGFGMAATKYVAQFRRADTDKTGRIIGFTYLVTVIVASLVALYLFLAARYLAIHWLAAPDLVTPLRISSLLLLFSTISGLQTGILAGFEAFRKTAQISIWVSVISVFAIIGANFGVPGVIWSMVSTAALNCLLNRLVLKRVLHEAGICVQFKSCWEEWHIIYEYSLPAVLTNMLYIPIFWYCTTLLVNSAHGYEEMGVFSAANQWRNLATFVPGILGQAVVPIISDCASNGKNIEVLNLLYKLFKILVVVGSPVFILLCLMSKAIMHMYGADFSAGWDVFCILQAAVFLQILQAPIIKYMEATGRLWINLLFNSGLSAVMIITTLLLVKYGASGLALAILASFIAHSLWLGWYAMSIVRHPCRENACRPVSMPISRI